MERVLRLSVICFLACCLIATASQGQESLTGVVKVRVLDDVTNPQVQFLVGKTILEFESTPEIWVGDIVEAVGVRDGNVLYVSSYEVKKRSRRLDAPLVRDPMAHTTAILAMGDANVNQNTALNAMDQADAFWTEVTRGFDSLVGGVFEKYSINYNSSDCNFNNTDNLVDKLIDAFENDGYNADDYDHILTIVPRDCGSWTGAWAYIGGITDNGQLRFATVSMYKDNVVTAGFFVHELGHNIGMNHARARDCGKDPYYKPNGCSTSEYGNYNDNMGNGDDDTWYSGPYQRYLGWIKAKHVVTAGRSSDFNLLPIDDTFDCGIQALRVPIPDENGAYFYVEFRHPGGTYSGTGPSNNKRNAVLITKSRDGVGSNDSSFTDRIELDVGRFDGAEVGKLYDLGKGVSVRVQSMGSIAKVSIAMPGNSNHRDDDSNVILPNSDGTYGEIECGPVVEDPYIQMSKGTYLVNEQITVRYFNLPDSDLNWIGIFNRGAGNEQFLEWFYVQGVSGQVDFAGQQAGNYDARLFLDDSSTVAYEVQFKVKEEEEPPPEVNCKGDTLKSKKKLKPGQYICSKNDQYAFGLHVNGKLHLIRLTDNAEIWTDGICCDADSILRMQKDGNLVHYGSDGQVLFASGTQGNKKAKLKMRDSGVAVILNKKKEVIWSTEGDEPPPEDPYIETNKKKYDVGEQIVVRFFNLPSGDMHWIGLYNRGDDHDQYLVWEWARGGTGSVDFDGLNAGNYDARLFFDDSYVLEYEVKFQVEGDDPPPEGEVELTLDPYAGVNWSWEQYKANYHTHTTESDGSHSPATTIDQYYNAGYKILAITDHNTITWPWTDYNRDPNELGMLAVKGDEYSNSHHMNAFHNFSRSSSNMETGIPHLQSNGGVGQWNHPLRYNDAGDWNWYVGWARDYDSMVGIEVINRTNTNARNLWDNINENFYRTDGRFVWGHANDDKHGSGDLFRAFQFVLMSNLTKAQHMQAMKLGRSYFCIEPGGSGNARVPRIASIAIDEQAKTIRINATGQDSIRWIGPGTQRVGTGPVFDYSEYKNKPFVRVRLDGSNGDCFTQPFGFTTKD